MSPLLRMPVDGGEETEVGPQVVDRTWSVSSQGVWFIVPDGAQRAELRFLNTATGKVSVAARIGKPVNTGLALSPDEPTLLYNQVDHAGTEILLVENFR